MKIRRLRRVFCVALCAAVLACSCVNALGAELFELEFNDLTAFQWANRNTALLSLNIS